MVHSHVQHRQHSGRASGSSSRPPTSTTTGQPARATAMPVGSASNSSNSSSTAGVGAREAGTEAGLHPPPPSPASPALAIPSSVVLPRQPYPSPSDSRRQLSTTRRPASPPHPSTRDLPTVHEDAAVKGGNNKQPRHQQQEQQVPGVEQHGQPGAAQMQPILPQQQQQRKKNTMFFINSPTTDSDDETSLAARALPGNHGPASNKGRKHNSSQKVKASSPMSPGHDKQHPQIQRVNDSHPTTQHQHQHHPQHPDNNPPAPPKLVTPDERPPQHAAHHDDEDGDDDYEDEDDSDWSSEASEEDPSSEDERLAAAQRAEAQRERDMFAKRVPSQVAVHGLLSQILHPEWYPRDFANLPPHLRNNKSAVELARARPAGALPPGLDRVAQDRGNHLTVTGLHASKSSAVLSGLNGGKAGDGRIKSGNHLTRLGGRPSGVELETDDEDDSDTEQNLASSSRRNGDGSGQGNGNNNGNGNGNSSAALSTSRQAKLAQLMKRSGSRDERTSAAAAGAASNMQRCSSSGGSSGGGSSAGLTRLTRTASTAAIVSETVQAPIIQPGLPASNATTKLLGAAAAAGAPNGGAAYTPRTTRRTMLAAELTESLRLSLLWERQTKTRLQNGGVTNAPGIRGNGKAVSSAAALKPPSAPSSEPLPATVVHPPTQVQKGADKFREEVAVHRGSGTKPDAERPSLSKSGLPGPVSHLRSSADAQPDYYSPGFHHVGW